MIKTAENKEVFDKLRKEYWETKIKGFEAGGSELKWEENVLFSKYIKARDEAKKKMQEMRQLQNQIKQAEDRVRGVEGDIIALSSKAESYLDAAAELFCDPQVNSGDAHENDVCDPVGAPAASTIDGAGRLEAND